MEKLRSTLPLGTSRAEMQQLFSQAPHVNGKVELFWNQLLDPLLDFLRDSMMTHSTS